jgi:hypothetical protein
VPAAGQDRGVAAGISIVLILAGLPLLAWWLGGRSFWSRAERRGQPDVFGEMVRRHGLRPGEIPTVEGAVTWGRRLEEPRLRAAVVDWATTMRRQQAERRRRNPRARRVVIALLFLWLLAIVLRVAHAAFEGRWGDVAWGLAWLGLLVAPQFAFPWRLRRAVELNRDDAAVPPRDAG